MITPFPSSHPHNPWLAHSVRIQRVTQETPGVATYDMAFDDASVAESFQFLPGQFNMVYLPGVGEVAISISGDPGQRGVVPHTIREAGNVTKTLARLPLNASVALRGPFGSSWPVESCVGKDVVIVAGGIGLAPLRPAILHLLKHRSELDELTLIVGARDSSLLLYPEQYDDWRAKGMNVLVTVDRADDSWHGCIGMVTAVLDRLWLRDASKTVVMTCGPEVMMWYTVQTAIRRGIPSAQCFLSLERNMNCAIGLCGHCQFGPEFLCKDGPVFCFDRVASRMKVEDL